MTWMDRLKIGAADRVEQAMVYRNISGWAKNNFSMIAKIEMIRQQLIKASAECERLNRLIYEHNDACLEQCAYYGKSRDNCVDYTERGRQCPDCPRDWMIEVEERET